MKIQRLSCFGIRGLADLELDLADPTSRVPHPLVLVTGGPASGKTRLLEAIVAAKEAIGPYGPIRPSTPWIDRGGIARMVLRFYLNAEEQLYAGLDSPEVDAEVFFLEGAVRATAADGLTAVLERYVHDPSVGKVEYFPTWRAVPPRPPFPRLGLAEQRLARLSSNERKYAFVARFLQELGRDAAQERAFAELLELLSATCRYSPSPDAAGRCLSSRGARPVTVAELSSGEADAVLVAATAVGIGLANSVVLVDRPELYAGVAGAQRLVAGLGSSARDNQLLLASGSPELPAALASAHIVSLGVR